MQTSKLDNSVNILFKNECTGCSVCYISCPHNAINMIETKEGFHYPVINKEKCTNCGVCVKKCHSLNSDRIKKDFYQEKYDIRANDEIRMKSASGGMFTLLADYVLDNNGYVCGASFTDDYLGVHHIIINDKKDLDKLRGSKYIESDLGNIFNDIKKLLNENKLVLFTGTPCQVAALNSFLLRDYDNLITADLICHGVPPQKIWKKYIKEKFNNEKIEYVSFRDKVKIGWGIGLYVKLKNGSEYIQKNKNDLYVKAYLEDNIYKSECIHCKYRNNRVADITLADFWGIGNITERKKDISKGVSRVLVNSKKGKEIFDIIKDKALYYKKYNHKPAENSHSIGILTNREYLFDNLDNEPFDQLIEKINDKKLNVFIDNVVYSENYGSILTYYALYKIIHKMGYNPILPWLGGLSNFLKENSYINESSYSYKFIKKYMSIPYYKYTNDIVNKIIDMCDTIMIGSDQMWSPAMKDKLYFHLFNFLKEKSKKKISYSTSMGPSFRFNGENNISTKFNFYINQFDYVSIRELKQVDSMKERFNISVTHVMDPVFLLKKEEYEYLINNYNMNVEEKQFIFIYIRYFKEIEKLENNGIILYLIEFSKKNNKKIIFNICSSIFAGIDYKDKIEAFALKYKIDVRVAVNVEEWLYYIKNADYVITNSFHATCFCLIFNKEFLTILENGVNNDRLETLKTIFNIDRKVLACKDINYEIIEKGLLEKINFDDINNIIKEKSDFSYNWLKNALESEITIKDNYYYDELLKFLLEENRRLELSNMDILDKLHNTIDNKIDIDNKINSLNNKINNLVDTLAWWIPFKKKRDEFRAKFK